MPEVGHLLVGRCETIGSKRPIPSANAFFVTMVVVFNNGMPARIAGIVVGERSAHDAGIGASGAEPRHSR